MTRIEQQKSFYADLVTAKGGSRDERLRRAFATVDRQKFVGPGPWSVATAAGYVHTPSDDPEYLFQDIVIGLIPEQGINNGEPSLHARCLDAVTVKPGEQVLHIGTGAGYYTALLAELTGPTGAVHAYEILPELAERATRNLTGYANVTVVARSGSEGRLPAADVIYVSAGATEPLAIWVDAMKPGGRLIFPLTPDHGFGGMLLVTRRSENRFDARFVSPAIFVPCIGARQQTTAQTLWKAFKRGSEHWNVCSLRRNGQPDASCWAAGEGWWLSTRDE